MMTLMNIIFDIIMYYSDINGYNNSIYKDSMVFDSLIEKCVKNIVSFFSIVHTQLIQHYFSTNRLEILDLDKQPHYDICSGEKTLQYNKMDIKDSLYKP